MRHLLKAPTDGIFLLITTFLFFLLRLPSLAEPYWYGDESIYEAVGFAMRHGRLLYSGIWDNKPPLLYVIYALCNGDLFWVKLTSLLFGVTSVWAFFTLARKLFASRLAIYISTAFFAFFFAIPMFEGNIANAENFMLLPIILAANFLFPLAKKQSAHQSLFRSPSFMSGLLLGIAFLFKIVAIFDTISFALFIILSMLPSLPAVVKKFKPKVYFKVLRPFIFPLKIGFLLPFVLTCLFFLLNGALLDFLSAAFVQNVGYVDYGNHFLIPQGILIGKTLLLVVGVTILWWHNDKLTRPLRFILLWFGFALFSAYFSQRPYTHYLLVLLPAFSLAVGLLVSQTQKVRMTIAVCLILITVLLLKTFWYNNPPKTIGYYTNFVQFITNQKDVIAYQAFFDKRTPVDYEILAYLRLNLKPDDQLFIWGNAAELYPLTGKVPPGRYTVAYHMTANKQTMDETTNALLESKPKYIVIFPNVGYIPLYLTTYKQAVTIEDVTIYERSI